MIVPQSGGKELTKETSSNLNSRRGFKQSALELRERVINDNKKLEREAWIKLNLSRRLEKDDQSSVN